MIFRNKLKQPFIVEEVCNRAQSLVVELTRDMDVPTGARADEIRKRTAMFIFGLISGLAQNEALEPSPTYQAYLQYMGGLDKTQAFTAVEIAQKRIDRFEDAKLIYQQGRQLAKQWLNNNHLDKALFLQAIGMQSPKE